MTRLRDRLDERETSTMTTDKPTTTTHRHGCTRPGWLLERSSSIAGVTIARCVGCGAVELRTEATR